MPEKPRYTHILLADDDEDDRILFRDALNETGHEIPLSEVENGDDLMDFLLDDNRRTPDILFLDLNMPRKSGYECLSEIRATPGLQDLPIVILSTTSLDEGLVRMLRRYSCGYIQKPATYVELKNAVRDSLHGNLEVLDANFHAVH